MPWLENRDGEKIPDLAVDGDKIVNLVSLAEGIDTFTDGLWQDFKAFFTSPSIDTCSTVQIVRVPSSAESGEVDFDHFKFEDVKFLLRTDQVRRIVEAETAWYYLTQVAFGVDGFLAKLELLKDAVVAEIKVL